MGFGNYDAWKLACPDDERNEPTCRACGEYMEWHSGDLACRECEERDYALQRQADGAAELATLEDLEILAEEEAEGRRQ